MQRLRKLLTAAIAAVPAFYVGLAFPFAQWPMANNFLAMPTPLKLLTAVTVVAPIVCVVSLFPHQSIDVFGQPMTTSEWWSSGAGLTTVVVGGLMLSAAFLMLGRSRYGRPAYMLGVIVTDLSAPLIAYLTGKDFPAENSSLIVDLGVTAFIAWYLFKSRAVRNYFSMTPTPND